MMRYFDIGDRVVARDGNGVPVTGVIESFLFGVGGGARAALVTDDKRRVTVSMADLGCRACDNPPRGVTDADGPEEHTHEVVRQLANGLTHSDASGPMTATRTEKFGDHEVTYTVTIG